MRTGSTNPIKALPRIAKNALPALRRHVDIWLEDIRDIRRVTPFIAATLFTLCLAAGFTLLAPPSGPYGPYVCLPVNFKTLGPEDFSQGHNTRFPKGVAYTEATTRFSAVPIPVDSGALVSGALVSENTLSTGPDDWHYGLAAWVPPARKRGLVNFTLGLVSVESVDGPVPLALLRHSPIPTMTSAPDLFQSDMFTPVDHGDLPPLLYGEETDETGLPARWSRPVDALPGLMACSRANSYTSDLQKMLRKSRFAQGAGHSGRASTYKTVARRYAEKYNIAFPLVLAIMHTESNFNPYAVSRSQAIGLMQIVAETAGNEVHRYLTGLPGNPSQELLFSPEHNIRYGTTYLHLLGRHYFGGVINPRSRQMCVIAAYNGGPGAVLRAFDSDRSKAISRINTLSPDEVYKILTTDLPHAETRRYVDLVLARMQSYSAY
jgi:membrane-bound lytic murein transglycosylase C